jgi:hypothetical protein
VTRTRRDSRRRLLLGRRWLPGILSAFLGALGLLAVACLVSGQPEASFRSPALAV